MFLNSEPSCHCQKNSTGLHIHSLIWPRDFLLPLSTLNSESKWHGGPRACRSRTPISVTSRPPLSPALAGFLEPGERGLDAPFLTVLTHVPTEEGHYLNSHSGGLIWITGQLWNRPLSPPLTGQETSSAKGNNVLSITNLETGRQGMESCSESSRSLFYVTRPESLDRQPDVDGTWNGMFSYLVLRARVRMTFSSSCQNSDFIWGYNGVN